MTQAVIIELDGLQVPAFIGDRLLDAALLGGVAMPNDCRSGQCGTCVVRLHAGRLDGGEAEATGCFHACQSIVRSSLKVSLVGAPSNASGTLTSRGVVAATTELTHDVVEVTVAIHPATPFVWRAGQYAHVTFAGFPSRAFSPTMALDGSDRPGSFRLHIKRIEGGRVSPAIGRRIRPGHTLTLEGPVGRAALEPGFTGRLMLYASGTGFAPIWAVADAALRENAARRMVVVAGVDALENLYMAEALERMSGCPNVVVMPVTAEPQAYTPMIRSGPLIGFASMIAPGDRVHAAGPPSLLQALDAHARNVGATFHADAFNPGPTVEERWLGQIARQFASPATASAASHGHGR